MKIFSNLIILVVFPFLAQHILICSSISVKQRNSFLFLKPSLKYIDRKTLTKVIMNDKGLIKEEVLQNVNSLSLRTETSLKNKNENKENKEENEKEKENEKKKKENNLFKIFEKDMQEMSEKIKNYFDNNVFIENNKLENIIKDIELSTEEICVLYEDMYLGRLFENLVAKLYYNKKIHGFVHLYNGQEAISSGIIKNLRNSDFVVSTYRDHVHALSKNIPPEKILNELYGNYYDSINNGKGGSMHLFSKTHNFVGGFAFIGEQIPVSIGLAYSILYKENFNENIIHNIYEMKNNKNTSRIYTNTNTGTYTDTNTNTNTDTDVVICFLGDGTTNIGQFYESLNLASNYNLPIIFVVENNNWAIGMENSRSTINDMLSTYSKGKAFNIDTYKIHGNDVLSIYKLAKKKIKEIREKKTGPVLIEAITYRSKGHSLADPDELRITEEKSSWKQIDPINILTNYMKKLNIVDDCYFDKVKIKTNSLLKHIEQKAEENKLKKINVTEVLSNNIFAPSGYTPFQENYKNYEKQEELSDEELEKYYKAFVKEQKRKAEKQKIDPTEHFKEKSLPLIIY